MQRARAQLLVGNLYVLGQGVPKNAVAAFALCTVSANTEARGNLALGHRAQPAGGMSAQYAATVQQL